LFGGDDGSGGLVEKGDGRLRSIPLDTGRPTLEAVSAVVDCVLSCSVREMTVEDVRVSDETEENVVVERSGVEQGGEKGKQQQQQQQQQQAEEETKVLKNPTLSYTPLHEAVLKGDLDRLIELLNELEETEEQEVIVEDSNASEQFTPTIYDVNTQGGDDFQTPLHLASASARRFASSSSLRCFAAASSSAALSAAFFSFCRARCLRFFSNAFAFFNSTSSSVNGGPTFASSSQEQ